MATLVSIQNLAKSFGPRMLFKDMAFSVNDGEHLGVIGPNGAGKTTMFKVLTGQEEPDTGQIVRSRGLRLGYLPQHDDWKEDETVEHYLVNGCTMPLWELKTLGRGLGLEEQTYDAPMVSLSAATACGQSFCACSASIEHHAAG